MKHTHQVTIVLTDETSIIRQYTGSPSGIMAKAQIANDINKWRKEGGFWFGPEGAPESYYPFHSIVKLEVVDVTPVVETVAEEQKPEPAKPEPAKPEHAKPEQTNEPSPAPPAKTDALPNESPTPPKRKGFVAPPTT